MQAQPGAAGAGPQVASTSEQKEAENLQDADVEVLDMEEES